MMILCIPNLEICFVTYSRSIRTNQRSKELFSKFQLKNEELNYLKLNQFLNQQTSLDSFENF